MNSPTPCPIPLPEISFNREQLLTLTALRDLYQEHHGLFTRHELARLRFVRWLYRTGRLTDRCERTQKVA